MKGIAIFFPSQQFALGPLKLCFPHSSVGKESSYNAEDPIQFLGWEDLLEKG